MGTDIPGKIIELRENKDGGKEIAEMFRRGELQGCEECNLEYAQHVSDDTLKTLSHATGLRKLNLNACQDYTDAGLLELARTCTSLTDLSLYWNVKIGDEGVGKITRNNSSLTSLSLSGCKRVTDECVIEVVQICTGLVSLDLTRCTSLTDNALEGIAKHCTVLEDLRFYACGGPADRGVGALNRSLYHLRVLDLCGSGRLTDEGFKPLADGTMPHLAKLNIGWCVGLADGSLHALGAGCHELRHLYVLGNVHMTLDGLKSISRGCTSLCGLDICGLKNVEDRSLDAMKALFPHLTMLAKLGQAPYYDD